MANSIDKAALYTEIIDEVFAREPLTRIFDDAAMVQKMDGVAEVKIPKISVQGLGSYSLTDGFNNGDVTFAYETKTLTQRRARSFSLDKIVNSETLDTAFAATAADHRSGSV